MRNDAASCFINALRSGRLVTIPFPTFDSYCNHGNKKILSLKTKKNVTQFYFDRDKNAFNLRINWKEMTFATRDVVGDE